MHETRSLPLPDAVHRRRVEADAALPMRIGLRQNERASLKAEEWLMAVSNPNSPDYGRHWGQSEVIDAFKPHDESVEAVRHWLERHEIVDDTHSENRQWLAFDLHVDSAEALLQTKYFEHQLDNGRYEVSCDRYYLPQHLRSHVDYITP